MPCNLQWVNYKKGSIGFCEETQNIKILICKHF